MHFKSVLSQTEIELKKIWEQLSETIKQIYDFIDMQNKSYLNIINENTNPAESSFTDLEKLVQIVDGTTLNVWNDYKNSCLIKLEKVNKWWGQEIKSFNERIKNDMKKILSLEFKSCSRIQTNYRKISKFIQKREDIYEMLTCIKDVDKSIFKVSIEIMSKVKPKFEVVQFLSKVDTVTLYQQYLDEQKIDIKTSIKNITNVLRNIQNHQINQNDYSGEIYWETKQKIINKIRENRNIIQFFKFLVHLTAFDNTFTQCGSNSLHLLVLMKVDLANSQFQNINIKNISLEGANFFRCNFSGSEFYNVDITGVNLNGSQLLNCKWINLVISKQAKFSAEGSLILSGEFFNNKGKN